jgi:hypothetical protein
LIISLLPLILIRRYAIIDTPLRLLPLFHIDDAIIIAIILLIDADAMPLR